MASSSDTDELEFVRAHRRRRLRLALVLAVAVLGPLGLLIAREAQLAAVKRDARLSPAQKAELSTLLDRRESHARERLDHWNAAVQPEALAGLAVGTGDCPIKLVPPTQPSAAAYLKYATHDSAFGAWTLCILRPAADAPACTRTYGVDPELAGLRQRISDDDVYQWDLEHAKSAPAEIEAPSVVVVVGAETRPDVHPGTVGRVTFLPGALSGRTLLYAPEQAGFLCGGDVSVRNSKTIDIEFSTFGEAASAQKNQAEYETKAALERDLELHLRFATPGALKLLFRPRG